MPLTADGLGPAGELGVPFTRMATSMQPPHAGHDYRVAVVVPHSPVPGP